MRATGAFRLLAVLTISAAALAGTWGSESHAARTGPQFRVKVAVIGQQAQVSTIGQEVRQGSGLCTSRNLPGAYGAVVTVVCSTGVVVELIAGDPARQWSPMHGGAYRFLLPYLGAGVMEPHSSLHTGLGTVTSWRVVHLVDREYLEMTVRW